MKPVLAFGAAAVLAAILISCGGGTGMPDANSMSSSGELAPTFTGTGVDTNANTGGGVGGVGTTIVSWRVAQAGANVSGTVTTQSTDAPGTCASCHRSRTGALSGTITGTALHWTATFPADPAKDPTPICAATLSGTITDITADSVSGTYSGADTCEGQYTNGTLTMARTPAPANPSPGM
jgi:hypothetical protein